MSRPGGHPHSFGLFLVLFGAAATAFGTLGLSVIGLVIVLGGATALIVGLLFLRPSGRAMLWLLAAIAFVTMPIWLIFLVGSLAD